MEIGKPEPGESKIISVEVCEGICVWGCAIEIYLMQLNTDRKMEFGMTI